MRLPLAKQADVSEMLNDMQRRGVIVRRRSGQAEDWGTPFLRGLQEVKRCHKERLFPLLRIDDTPDTLAGAQWFSTLDLKSEYWQVDIRPDDKGKTAFSTGQALWKCTVMPFGLCNVPATFESLMEKVLRGLIYDSYLVYFEDVIVIGSTFQEPLLNLRIVFQRLREARLKLDP
jgi:hypothetical protein